VAVVANEAKFSKSVHEETHAGPRRSDHLRKRLLADFRDDRLGFAFLAKIRQQQEQTGKTFLARIEQLIDEVCFDADGPTLIHPLIFRRRSFATVGTNFD